MAIFSMTRYKGGSVVAVWKIEETETELLTCCAVPSSELEEMSYISNPQRRLERLVVRMLLNEVLGEKIYLGYHDNGRPFLHNHAANISITHTRTFVAVICHPALDVGIDIESIARNFDAVEKKALSDAERNYLSDKYRQAQLCLIWSAKEALYKRVGENGVDFSAQMRIEKFTPKKQGKLTAVYIGKERRKTTFTLRYKMIEDHILVWVAM